MKSKSDYYLGLDIGTDSIGYAVTSLDYKLKKYNGEPMWGTMLFEAADTAAERRTHRAQRRRLDRRQARVQLLEELLAPEIIKTDPNFFNRRRESALFADDRKYKVRLFDGGSITDKEYREKYKTIHHLICELMKSDEPHDLRCIYIACAWLVAHRGHFLFDTPNDKTSELLDFKRVYDAFFDYFDDNEYTLPWSKDISHEDIRRKLIEECGVKEKSEQLKALCIGDSRGARSDERSPYKIEGIIELLAGKTVKPKDLFADGDHDELGSISLAYDNDEFDARIAELGDDGELLSRLRDMLDCAKLISVMGDKSSISEAKIAVYDRHDKDLVYLKDFVKKYLPKEYTKIFRYPREDKSSKNDTYDGNYALYTHNIKSKQKGDAAKYKFVSKEAFSESLYKKLKDIPVSDEDAEKYNEMLKRLEARTFLPKQRDPDNCRIPQQLYRAELAKILEKAKRYTPHLCEQDEDGLSIADKILSIFDHKIPYYVGPLRRGGRNAWIERKAEGRILPWNFDAMVDLEKSEAGFIKRMTNQCTYYPGKNVLPEHSLLYERFKVLDELNKVKINGNDIPVKVKQELYTEVYEKYRRVTVKRIKEHLVQRGHIEKDDEISGLDENIRSELRSYHIFKRLLESKILREKDVESIIEHMAYCEDRSRMSHWLNAEFPQLTDEDQKYIIKNMMKGFGRFSKEFLAELKGRRTDSDDEERTIIELLYDTNENHNQLLSDKYTFSEKLREIKKEYYEQYDSSLDNKLDDLRISNAVKRPIYRTLDIIKDVVKTMGCEPTKIFIEMARGGKPEQKGKRTQSRREQLKKIYKGIGKDARELQKQLDERSDNELQNDRLFLYFLQMGKDAYTGEPISLSELSSKFDRDHIYPQSYVKDDSIWNNLVLVNKEDNENASNTYPKPEKIRKKMTATWQAWKNAGAMTEEKYRRLTRATPFTDDEKLGFINRQLVETRQSTKAVAALLQEHYKSSEIVYVKAGMVSEYRQEFKLLKCRQVNDLHHAKDAYLNIVVGNVYNERFSKAWFNIKDDYSVKVRAIFTHPCSHGDRCYWRGGEDIALVKETMKKNAVHLTRYVFCRKGELFDVQPIKKQVGLVPRKKGLPTERYGGYNKAAVSFYALASFRDKKKHDIMFVPIELKDAPRFKRDSEYAKQYISDMISKIKGREPEEVSLLLNGRCIKIGTSLSLNGLRMTLSGKSSGGKEIILSPLTPLILGQELDNYVKAIAAFDEKIKKNPNIELDEEHDGISAGKNLELYDKLAEKLTSRPFCYLPSNQGELMKNNDSRTLFAEGDMIRQIKLLLGVIALICGDASTCDLTLIGGSKAAGSMTQSSSLSNLIKKYSDIRMIDTSAAGLHYEQSVNLCELL